MSIQEGLLVEIQRETANTKRIIEKLSDEHWTWKPHEKSMSAGQLAAHIVELHNWVYKAIDKDVFDFHVDYKPTTETNFADILASLDNGLNENTNFVKEKSEDFWFSPWTLKAGDHVLGQMHKLGAFRFIIANHLIHHRGQLSVYLRMLDLPLPGIYGPSADEK